MSDARKTGEKTASPRWAREFPIHQQEEARISRRGFMACLGTAGAMGVMGALLTEMRPAAADADADEGFDLGAMPDLAVGESAAFAHPDTGRPILLIHLSPGRYAAYDQRCTHLLCPVHYDAGAERIICPCHHGVFSAEDGRPLAGPPRAPLPKFSVSVENGRLRLRRAGAR